MRDGAHVPETGWTVDERLLLVEDDASIREIVSIGLKAAGFRVLVVGGTDDKLVLHAAAEFIAHHTGGRLLSYKRTGHATMLEQAERFNADLASFVG